MFFSLILCTINRVDCLEELFESLTRQHGTDFEVIIVDQNKDNRVEKKINPYKEQIPIQIIKSEPGLSKARNVGLKAAKGNIVCFPDDDCYYSDDLLFKSQEFFLKNQDLDMLVIKMSNSIRDGRKVQEKTKDTYVTKENVFQLCASISMFVRRDVAIRVGGFDERLGLGSCTKYCSGEDYDFPLRILEAGGKIFYSRKIEVFHPWDDKRFHADRRVLQSSYWAGATELLLLNRYGFSKLFRIKWIARRLVIVFYFYLTGKRQKSQQSLFILKGNLSHWKKNEIIN